MNKALENNGGKIWR